MNKFERAPYPEHPNRCQALGGAGQCPFLGKKLDDGTYHKYCIRHAGQTLRTAEQKSLRMYAAAQWQVKIGAQADHPKIKSLREEIGILRMTLDAKLDSIKDEHDLILNTQSLTTLVREIRETADKCNKIEMATGQMLDRSQALSFVQEIIGIITCYLDDDPDILQMIAEDMIGAYDKMTSINEKNLKG